MKDNVIRENNCPNCGAPLKPDSVKCEYCGTTYFNWATLQIGHKPFYINMIDEKSGHRIVARCICRSVEMEQKLDTMCVDNFVDDRYISGFNPSYCIDLNLNLSVVSNMFDEHPALVIYKNEVNQ